MRQFSAPTHFAVCCHVPTATVLPYGASEEVMSDHREEPRCAASGLLCSDALLKQNQTTWGGGGVGWELVPESKSSVWQRRVEESLNVGGCVRL